METNVATTSNLAAPMAEALKPFAAIPPVVRGDTISPVPPRKSSALDVQEGGSHYKNMAIQPVEFIHKNGIGFIEGCAIKYLCRWRQKNGIEDLKKARHFIDMLIEMEQ